MNHRSLLKPLLLNRLTARAFLKPVLKIHSLSYELAGKLGIEAASDGAHPKHRIMKYEEWFKAKIRPEWRVADIGCNTGTMPRVLSEKAEFVYGIELVEKYVKHAEKKNARPNIKYLCADATKADLSAFQVDCITLSNVLEHIEHRVEFLTRLLRNIAWRNPSEKCLLIRVPMIDRDWIAVYKKELGMDFRLDVTHFTEYTQEQFEGEMRDAGVRILEMEIRFGEIYAVCRAA